MGIVIPHNNNTIDGNTIRNNLAGIHLQGKYNTIRGNRVSDNIESGISSQHGSDNNTIYHNSFINNPTNQVSGGYFDIWDNGYEGNYWSDYAGEDLNQDGVGDTLLPHQGVDNYPLMSPYIEGDVNHDAVVDIVDGVIMGVAFGTEPSDPKWNPHADLSEDGVIDIIDIVIWATHFGESW